MPALKRRIELNAEESIIMFFSILKQNPGSKMFEILEHMDCDYNYEHAPIKNRVWQMLDAGKLSAGLKWELTFNE